MACGWGREPIFGLAKLRIALATRGYTPMDITHYQASWVSGADRYPYPMWPRLMANGRLFVSSKPGLSAEARRPMVIEATFDRATPLRMRVNVVSSRSDTGRQSRWHCVLAKDVRPGTRYRRVEAGELCQRMEYVSECL